MTKFHLPSFNSPANSEEFRQNWKNSFVCHCDLKDRQWNPNTGRCENCGSKYVEADNNG